MQNMNNLFNDPTSNMIACRLSPEFAAVNGYFNLQNQNYMQYSAMNSGMMFNQNGYMQ